MDGEIQLISDGKGLAVIGPPGAVEQFLASEGLPSTDLGLQRLRPALTTAASVTQAASELAANSGRWVKLTDESAQAIKRYGLMKSKTSGLELGVVQAKGQGGGIKHIVQFAKGSGVRPTNPALLAGAAGIMAQVAMQQTMKEITDYLATIDEKVEDVLRAQKDAVLANMIGVRLVIDEAMTVREHVGSVSEVTWSKVQGTALTIAQTQAYALRQLDALAEKIEKEDKISDVAKASRDAQAKVKEWLAVLAHCFQLQDAIAVLELDRALEAASDELDRHRLGLEAARRNRVELITRATGTLLTRLDTAASEANMKVLLHPRPSRAVVESRNHVAVAVGEFHTRLGIEGDRQSLEARRWFDAATEAKDKVLQTTADSTDAAKALGVDTFDRAKSATTRLSSGLVNRARRRGRDGDGDD